MTSGVVIVLANPCAHARSASLSSGTSNDVAIVVEVRRASRQMRWGVEGVEALALPWSRLILCLRVVAHALRGSCEGERYKR